MFVHFSGQWQEVVVQHGHITMVCAKLYCQWILNKHN